MNEQEQKESDNTDNENIESQENESNVSSKLEENKGEEVKKKKEKEEKEEEKFKKLSREELIGRINELENKLGEKQEEIKKLKQLNEDWKDKFMRLQAEFENTQKRWEKSRKHLRTQYTANALKNFLSIYDSFKSAVKNEDKNGHIEQFYKQFMNIMKSMGAHPMNTEELQNFDYNKHEALSSIERDDLPNNTIVDVIQDGWMYEKEVIRYAKVIISRKPKPPKPKKEETEKEGKEENEVNQIEGDHKGSNKDKKEIKGNNSQKSSKEK